MLGLPIVLKASDILLLIPPEYFSTLRSPESARPTTFSLYYTNLSKSFISTLLSV